MVVDRHGGSGQEQAPILIGFFAFVDVPNRAATTVLVVHPDYFSERGCYPSSQPRARPHGRRGVQSRVCRVRASGRACCTDAVVRSLRDAARAAAGGRYTAVFRLWAPRHRRRGIDRFQPTLRSPRHTSQPRGRIETPRQAARDHRPRSATACDTARSAPGHSVSRIFGIIQTDCLCSRLNRRHCCRSAGHGATSS